MPDAFDRLVLDLKRMDASARVGALDEVNAKKLAYSEFGTVTEPPRPTISAVFDQTEGAMKRAIDRRIVAVLDGKSHKTGEAILAEVAEDQAALVIEAIDGNTPPALAKSTLAARRVRGNDSDRTLVDTGNMRDHIKVETKNDAKAWGDDE